MFSRLLSQDSALSAYLESLSCRLDVLTLCRTLLVLCDEAQACALEFYHRAEPVAVDRKDDNSPVTEADKALHTLICGNLRALIDGIPVLSEESGSSTMAARTQWQSLWMVDPLDGTKEFINRTGEFTINIALIVKHRPVLGIISSPSERCHYLGIPGIGAFKVPTGGSLDTNATRMHCKTLTTDRPLVLLASERHSPVRVEEVIGRLRALTGAVTRLNAGSALKFCRLIDRAGDVYPRTSPCYEWDVAAGDALVTAAGGQLIGLDGNQPVYNQNESLLAPRFIAQGDAMVDYLTLLKDCLE